MRKNVRRCAKKNVRRYVRQGARGELEASGRGSLHGHWEMRGVSLTVQSAIEQFARKRGGGGGDEADIKSSNARLTDAQPG